MPRSIRLLRRSLLRGQIASRRRSRVPILAVLGLGIVLLAACNNADAKGEALGGRPTPAPSTGTRDTPASATTVVTSTPLSGGERDGAAGLREFAGQVQAAFENHDSAFFIQRMKGRSVVCTPADLDRKGPEGRPLCASNGTYRGFVTGRWRSEWETVPLEEAFQSLMGIVETVEPTARDLVGPGRLQVRALDVTPGEYQVIATALALRPKEEPQRGPTRVSLSLTAAFEGGKWQFTSLLTATVLAEDLVRPGTEFTARKTGWEIYRP